MGSIVKGIGSFFGLEDELIIASSKVSSKIYSQNVTEASKNAITKAVIGKASDTSSDHSYFDHYWYQLNSTKVSLTSFYRFGENRFPTSIPTSEMTGATVDEPSVISAIVSKYGSGNALKEVGSGYPTDLQHFQEYLQVAPYLYDPAVDKLTYTDSNTSTIYNDWAIEKVAFKSIDSTFDVTLTRQANIAEFWLTGNGSVPEGSTASYTLHSTRKVPTGSPITVQLVYGGTAPGTDYTEVVSVDMLEGDDFVNFSVSTIENTLTEGSRDFTVTIGTIDNSGNIFQAVASIVPNVITTTIYDNDTPTLYVHDKQVPEGTASILVGVEVLYDSPNPFTVDYTTVAGTATAGADYVTTSGTLSFQGEVGETLGISIPIISDLVDDSGETFKIVLSNSSEPTMDIASQGTVTITDASSGDPVTATVTTTEILNLPDYVRKQSLIIKYYNTLTDPLALDWHYWLYDLALNTYPGMVPTVETSTGFELFPLGVIRKEAVSLQNYATVEDQLLMDLMLKKLNLNTSEVIDNMEASPDIGSIREAYLNIGVSALDSGGIIAKLLWNLLYPVIVQTPISANQGDFKLTVTKDLIENVISWNFQEYSPALVGVIGAVGDFNHYVSGNNLIVRYQTSATLYDKIEVREVLGNYKVSYQGQFYIATNDIGSPDLTFPVSWFSLNELSSKEQMNVYDKIVRLDFYAIEEIKIAWYKTASFMKLFQVVLIVITIVSAGISAPATAGAATATTAGATSSILAIAQQIAINYAISAVVSKIAEATGSPFLAAAIGILAGVSLGTGDSFQSLNGMFDAKSLLRMSIDFAENLTKAYSTVLTQEAKQLGLDVDEFEKKAKERLDAISNADYQAAVDDGFLAFLRSADSYQTAAISGIFEYDAIFDYDRIIGKYNENLLRIGVV